MVEKHSKLGAGDVTGHTKVQVFQKNQESRVSSNIPAILDLVVCSRPDQQPPWVLQMKNQTHSNPPDPSSELYILQATPEIRPAALRLLVILSHVRA